VERDDEEIYAECECGCREAGFAVDWMAAMERAARLPGADRWLPHEAPWRVQPPGR
jgi:hypothetical protein